MTSSLPAGDPVLGRTLGEFVIREKIGAGGFGAVYRAEQPALAREAVIKVLHGQLLESEAGVRRFLLEARLASRLDHPYAAHIYAFGVEADGLIWIAMELVRGTPLDRLLDSQGRLPLDRFVPLCERICEVVHTAHEQGIVHRDLKPANVVVLTRAGRYLPKLLDLGIAKLVDHAAAGAAPPQADARPSVAAADGAGDETLEDRTMPSADATGSRGRSVAPAAVVTDGITAHGAIIGSPPYMAPEQWGDAAQAEARTDVYALGVLTYHCLTGRLPFRATTAHEMAWSHLHDPVPPLGDGLPAALDQVLARAMAKQPESRFATALEFAAALRTASGLAAEPDERLPALDPALRDAVVNGAPQPLAEAVAALEATRSRHHALAIADGAVRTAVRYLALVALAARTRLGGAPGVESELIADLVRAARRHALEDGEWLELAREVLRPFADRPGSHPIPELVALFFAAQDSARSPIVEELAVADRAFYRSGNEALGAYRSRLGLLERLLEATRFLARYPLVVRRPHGVESWMGLRRPRRALIDTHGAPLREGQPALLDGEGRPAVNLWPVMQVAAPSAGEPDELFLFDGKSRRGARLVALPGSLERHDDAIWDWFGRSLIADSLEKRADDEEERAPYRGLEAFTALDADSFFGREQEVEAFVNRLRSQGLLAVVGPSGAGKSSFIQAGVVPSLPAGWRALLFRPGATPLAALRSRLARAGLELDLDGASSAREVADRLCAAADQRRETLVVVVDQFEEILTLCGDPGERARTSELLAELGRSAEDPVRVVLLLRDDFLLRAETLPGLRERLTRGLKLLATPGREELLRILFAPARRAGYDFEDRNLPAEMVDAVADQPAALALLSFSASRLWELRDRHFKQLSRGAYRAMGGVGGALAQHAEATLSAMSPEEQRLVREAFRQLVTAEGTRAVLRRGELVEVLGRGPRAERAVEALIASRLVVTSEGEEGERIEIVHETLLGAWPRLLEWRREDSEGARLRDQLRAAARHWHDRGRPRGLLWRDEALSEYRIWRARYAGTLTDLEESFASASLAEAARGRRIRTALVAAAFLVLAAFLAVQVRAGLETQKARQLTESLLTDNYLEQGRRLLIAGQHVESALYLAEARRAGAHGPAIDFMIARAIQPLGAVTATMQGDGKVWAALFSPDGSRILTTSQRAATLWNRDGQRVADLGAAGGAAAAFSPSGSIAVTGDLDGALRVWSAADGAPIRTIEAHRDMIASAAFSRSNDRLATCGFDGAVKVWDTNSWRPLAVYRANRGYNDCALSPDGQRVAAGGDGPAAWIWSVDHSGPALELRHEGNISTVRFDPRGERLVAATWAGSATVWRVADGQLLLTLSGHGGHVDQAVFSPDGRWIATAARDATARVWDAGTGRLASTLRGHGGPVLSVAFDATGEAVATASEDGSAAVWDRETGARVTSLHGHGSTVYRAEFDPAGRRLLTASYDGTARLWNVTDTYLTRRLAGAEECEPSGSWRTPPADLVPIACRGGTRLVSLETGAVVARLPGAERAIASDGGSRVITLSGGALRLWDVASGAELASAPLSGERLPAAFAPGREAAVVGLADGMRWFDDRGPGRELFAGTAHASAIAFSPDGSRLVSAHEDGTVLVIDAARGSLVGRPGRTGPAESIRFSPDGGRALVVGTTGAPLLIDPVRGKPIAELRGHGERVFGAHFDAVGRRVVTASGDKDARIWDAGDGHLIGVLTGGPQFVHDAAFDPAGELVATLGGDGALRFWDATPPNRMLWVAEGHHTFGTDVRFIATGRLVTRGWDGDLLWWGFPPEPIDLGNLDRFLRCRAHKRFDPAKNLVVTAIPDCTRRE